MGHDSYPVGPVTAQSVLGLLRTSDTTSIPQDTNKVNTNETSGTNASRVEPDRNCWTLLIPPPHATATVHSPRRALAVVRPAVGRPTFETETVGTHHGGVRPHTVGRTWEVCAGGNGLVAQLDWLSEAVAAPLNRGFGVELSEPVPNWHEAPLDTVVAEVADRLRRK